MLGEVPAQLDLAVRGTGLGGTFTGPRGRVQPIEQGLAHGSHVAFVIQGPHGALRFEGDLVGDALRGSARGPRGALPWRAVRCAR
jgi:hypothetical protein